MSGRDLVTFIGWTGTSGQRQTKHTTVLNSIIVRGSKNTAIAKQMMAFGLRMMHSQGAEVEAFDTEICGHSAVMALTSISSTLPRDIAPTLKALYQLCFDFLLFTEWETCYLGWSCSASFA